MDDDFTFGASVWGSDEPSTALPPSRPTISASHTSFGDDDGFDDFNEPVEVVQGNTEDDDFGDFGDFGEAGTVGSSEFVDNDGFGEDARIAGPSFSTDWDPLQLHPLPSRQDLNEQLQNILEPLWGYNDLSNTLTSEDIRDVEGVGQILVTTESRDLYKMLIQTPPPTKPPNWIRSRTRRQHLIALGIPVNLDEVLPHANGKPLPPLEITTRPMSAPPGMRNPMQQNGSPASTSNSRAGTPQPGRQAIASHFGPKPELDHAKIEKLLDLDPDALTLETLQSLERTLTELRAQTASTSALLTHLLQSRETLQQDSEMYNGLIAELVGEAQKMKSGKPSRTNSVRQSSRN
ncbi:hypothetical protein H0H92_014930 [Tricholoma furcatifolium]|nr:hypothetical protein H0H92_014930 [Tricholoma furcatifolium]